MLYRAVPFHLPHEFQRKAQRSFAGAFVRAAAAAAMAIAPVAVPAAAQAPARAPTPATPARVASDGAPGPGWIAVPPGKPVFLTPDSLRRVGKDTYRYVVFRRLGDAESLETSEARCSDNTRRTLRTETRGRYIVPDKRGRHVQVQETANEAFVNPYPGGAADVMVRKVCDLAHAKFGKRKPR